jgi:hypothetical protein
MATTPSPQPRRVPFAHGFGWLLQGLVLMRRQPGRLLLITVLMQLVLGLTQVPLIGLLVVLSVPGLGAGLLQALHVTATGGRPQLKTLFQPLASGRHSGRLLALGALVFAVGVVTISLLLSGNEDLMDPALVERIGQGDVDAMASLNQETLGRMVLAFLIGVSVSGTLSFFTIPLLWFGDRKLGRALGEGLRALFANWAAFLALSLGLMAAAVPVGVVSGVLFGLAAGGGALAGAVLALILLLVLAFQLLLFAAQYCAYRDIFGITPEPEPTAEADDAQLLA